MILVSPTKTKKILKEVEKNNLFNDKIEYIIKNINEMPIEKFSKILHLKLDKAQILKDVYNNYKKEKQGIAIDTYIGTVFKKMEIANMSKEDREYLYNNLYIFSALYGILRPYHTIIEYRLDMLDKIGIDLYDYWRKEVNEILYKEKILFNLASKEYIKILDEKNMKKLIDFEFIINGKQTGMNSKTMRGLMAKYIIENRIEDLNYLKKDILGYKYMVEKSNDKKLVYEKM